MTCPDTCKITQDVSNPCGSGGDGDSGDSTASLHAVNTIIAAVIATGVVAVIQ